MVIHKPYCALLAVALTLSAISGWQRGAPDASPSPGVSLIVVSSEAQPDILSPEDTALYQSIFTAQDKADWASADAAIAKLDNKLLVGHALATRYLSDEYNATPQVLAAWLDHYRDHPQAAAIYGLAVAKSPALKNSIPPILPQATLSGYGDDNGLAGMSSDNPYARRWQAALKAWRLGRKPEAAKLFSALAEESEKLSPWMASAAAYWSWRSYRAMSNEAAAEPYLRMAAMEPRSFYGILARRELKEKLHLDARPVHLTDSDRLTMVGDQSIRRAVALAQTGLGELAERELRMVFPQADDEGKSRLLALAHELKLPSVQISMARQLGRDGRELDFARYPIPNWRPLDGFKIDPLLVYALMRQESGFRASAVSKDGAQGLMQIMPQTAQHIRKKMDAPEDGALSEPSLNMTLGQNYLEHLLENELVEGNLFYLLAAYNAGPGKLKEWKSRIGGGTDPLLFVESIPFPETRHYVMQVMTNYWIYCELTGAAHSSVYALLHGHWPTYNALLPVAAAADAKGQMSKGNS